MQTIASVAEARNRGALDFRSMVGPDDHRPGKHRWRLVEDNLPVWAVILHLKALVADGELQHISDAIIAETAGDFSITPVSVVAAIAYYRDNQQTIDSFLLMNEEAVS